MVRGRYKSSGSLLLVAVSLCAAGVSGPAGGAPAADSPPVWGPRVPLSAAGANAEFPDVAVDRQGTATVVWERRGRIQAVRRPAGGVWGGPVTIGRGYGPMVAADARGNVTVVWSDLRSSRPVSARRPAGNGWRDPVQIGRTNGGVHDLVVNAAGAVVAVWVRYRDDGLERVWASYRSVGSGWQSPELVASTEDTGSKLEAAIDGEGNAVTVFTATGGQLVAVRRVVDRGWGRPAPISGPVKNGEGNMFPDVAMDPAGNIVAVWWHRRDVDTDTTRTRVWSARRPLGGPWEHPETVASDNGPYIRVGMDRAGRATAAWTGRGAIVAADRRLADPWNAPTTVAEPITEYASPLELAINARGDVLLAWNRGFITGAPDFSEEWLTQTAYRPRGGAWTDPQTIAGQYNYDTQLAVAGDGDAVAVWTRNREGTRHARVVARLMTTRGH